MITKWILANFKSVRQRKELELGPLTVFAGPNSSGKSTCIQSMLLISQTVASKVQSRSVILNGNLAKLGQFEDLRSFKSRVPQITIGWECRPLEAPSRRTEGVSTAAARRFVGYGLRASHLKTVAYEVSFDVDRSKPRSDLLQLQPRLLACRISCAARDEAGSTSTASLVATRGRRVRDGSQSQLDRYSIPEPRNSDVKASLDYEVKIDQDSLKELRSQYRSAEPVGCMFRHFLPSLLTLRINQLEEYARLVASVICEDLPSQTYRSFRYVRSENSPIPSGVIDLLRTHVGDQLRSLPTGQPTVHEDEGAQDAPTPLVTLEDWSRWVRGLPPTRRMALRQALLPLIEKVYHAAMDGRPTTFDLAPARLPSVLADSVDYVDAMFSSSLKYLGPLRDEPKALYPLSPTGDPSDVGLRGEYTAAVFDLHKNELISYIPPSAFGDGGPAKTEPVTDTLERAVLDWVRYMGVAEGIYTRDRGKLGHELKVATTGLDTPHDLTHVGVGVSQVLPILVLCLLARPDTTTVLEQPELHLHPKVQTLLGDFFLSMALLQKQCIIETHSEYLINRLRLRIASAHENSLTSITKMYFVEKLEGVSSFREVFVNRFGSIIDWPDGFFDQSLRETESILVAATTKKRLERGRLPNA